MTTSAADREPRNWRDDLTRLAQVFLGLFSAGLAVVVLAEPSVSLAGLDELLAVAVGCVAGQTILAGSSGLTANPQGAPANPWLRRLVGPWGVVVIGLFGVVLSVFAGLDSLLAVRAVVIVLALALVTQGLARVFQSGGVPLPAWARGSALTTGILSLVLIAASFVFDGFVLAAFAILVGLVLLIGGIESIVAGLRPTDPRQFILLKLILFAAFYGLILINWIDLFGKTVPGYGLWLIMTYMAPFAVLLVFEGWEAWPLATSLGLLVSLFNDVGYFFIGNLIFGFHVNLPLWIAGQLGFRGSFVVTTFQGGNFALDVPSWLMGLSIYARAAVVSGILYYWWRHPGRMPQSALGPTGTVPA